MKLSPNDLVVMKLLHKQPSIYTKREQQKRHVISVSSFFLTFSACLPFKAQLFKCSEQHLILLDEVFIITIMYQNPAQCCERQKKPLEVTWSVLNDKSLQLLQKIVVRRAPQIDEAFLGIHDRFLTFWSCFHKQKTVQT